MARPGYESDRMVLMLRNLENGETRKLTETWDRSVASIACAPDGKSLYVTAQEAHETPVFRVYAPNGKVERLTDSTDATAGKNGEDTPPSNGGILHSTPHVTTPTHLHNH